MKNHWLKLVLVIFLASVIMLGYGGLCPNKKKDKDTIISSSGLVTTIIVGEVYQQTSDNSMIPAGGVTVTANWSESTANQLMISQNAGGGGNKSSSTKTKSDGSYELTDIPQNTPVTITITSADTTQSIEQITTSAGVNNSSAILNGKGKKIGLIKKNQVTTLNTFDDDTLPRCQITVPANAVTADVDNVYLTPTHNGENLPQIPDGYVFLAGADFSAPSTVTFASGKEAAPYIILPPSVKAEDLTGVDIKLMEYINGSWVINTGKGKLFTAGNWAGHIGPHDTDTPAKLKGVRPWCWVAIQSSPAQISGTIINASGSPIAGAMVFGGGSKTNTNSNGAYTLKNIAVLKPNTLVAINVTANNYQMGYQFISLSPGSTVNNVNFTLEAVTQLAEVYGKVADAGDDSPILGTIVTLQTNPTIRGMKYDNKNSPTDLTDDTFYVIPPPGVNITNYKWMLTLPSTQKFTSLIENGSSIVLNQLATEATNAGYSLTVGAYKVELEVTYSGGKKVTVSGGFLIKQSGFISYIADVKLPVSIQDQLFLKTVTDASGNYRFINLPTGETLYAQAKAMGFISSNTVEITALSAGERRLQNFSLSDIGTDTEPPSQPANFTGTAQTAFSILLTWSPSTDINGIDYYRVYRNGTEIGKTTATSYLDAGLQPSTTYQYIIGAFDKANNSSLSNSINVTTPSDVIDNTAPTTPTNLAATVIGPTQINLSWWASTDDVGVIGYKVYQNGALRSTLNATNYSDTGLSANTEYEYKVCAYDAAGNTSDFSNVVTATTSAAADTTPPTVPVMNGAVALSSGSIAISWTASTDNVGVTGYKLYRSTDGISYTLRSTFNATSYEDSGLSASTQYWYKVSAVDGAGNTSAQSSSANATTQSGGGTGPIAWWKFDETSGTLATDSSGNGNNGTVYGPAWSGSALSFDGVDDYVDCGNASTLNFGKLDSLTVQAWFKTTSSGFQRIVSKGMIWTNPAGFSVMVDANNPHKASVSICDGMEVTTIYSTTNIDDGKWHHIVLVRNTSTDKIYVYIDGVKENEATDTTLQNLSSSVSVQVGRSWNAYAAGDYFNGKIDDVKIYNYARSQPEIQAEYEASIFPQVYSSIKTGKVVIGDVNNDGSLELIVGTYDSNRSTQLKVLKYQNNDLVELWSTTLVGYWCAPIVADVDTDGQNEIIVSTDDADSGGVVAIYEHTGGNVFSQVWSASFATCRGNRELSVGDCDNDGKNELVIGVNWYGRYMVVYEHTGGNNYSQSYRDSLGSDFMSTIVGDANNDGQNEIVAGVGSYGAYSWRVYKWTGANYNVTNIGLGSRAVQHSVCIADVNNDGANEVVVGTFDWNDPSGTLGGIRIYKWDGTQYSLLNTIKSGVDCFNVNVGNVLNNGKKQLVFFTEESKCYVYEYDGASFIKKWETGVSVNGWSNQENAVGDLNGDGANELILGNYVDGISIFTHRGW